MDMQKALEQLHSDYVLGGGIWGRRIAWSHTDFEVDVGNLDKEYKVTGFWPPSAWPKVGDTILAKMTQSYMQFKFSEVRAAGDPNDMFFGKVVLVGQVLTDGRVLQV